MLVVTGSQPYDVDPPGTGPSEPLEPDVQQILAALGLGS